jgi:HEAT repeat protein
VGAENIQKLFARTLEGGYDDDDPWDAIQALRTLGTREVFEVAASWCESDAPLMRTRGADVIAQLGKSVEHPSNSFPVESFKAISRMVETERDVRALASALFALGHLGNVAAVPHIASRAAHGDAGVRYAVAFALGCYPNEPKTIEVLTTLTSDAEGSIRDWAIFGVGVLGDADTAAVRDALAARLFDTDGDAREEALVGLAKRHDERALPCLVELLRQPDPSDRVLESASLMLDMSDQPEARASDYLQELERRFS